MSRLWRRLQYWVHRQKYQSELQEEIDFHRVMKGEELERSGMPKDESSIEANRSLGNVLIASEDARHAWIWPQLEQFLQDVRYGLRMLRKSPGLTAVAVLSLALAIGANSLVFSMVNALLFKPLPVESPDRLVWAYSTFDGATEPNLAFSYPDYLDYRTQTDAFSDLFAYSEGPMRLLVDGTPTVVWGAVATENFFTGLRLTASLGRTFTAEDGSAPGTVPLAVINDGMWRRHFGGDPSVVGKSLTINGRDFTVIGVLPAAFSGTRAFAFIPDVWIPLSMSTERAEALKDRNNAFLLMMGRMKPGVRIGQASASLETIGDRLNREHRTPETATTPQLMSGSRKVNPIVENTGMLQAGSAVTLALVGFVLLIACANVANLVLTRVSSRRREIALRLALGATRVRLTRQLLFESLLLSSIGGVVGLLLANWLKNSTLAFIIPASDFDVVETAYTFALDWRIIGFTTLVSFVAGIVCGVAPALQASRTNLTDSLKGIFKVRTAGRFRNSLVVAQVALCIVLLVCAGLSIRSALNARNVDPGFSTTNLLMMRVNLELQGYDQADRRQFSRDVRQSLESLPGVISASAGFPLPLDAYNFSRTAVPQGFVAGPGTERGFNVGFSWVAPGYFETMQSPLVAGRSFEDFDSENTNRVVVVNQTMARRFWPDEDAIGKRIRLGVTEGPYATVIGVVQDGKYVGLGEAPQSYMFLSALQDFPGLTTIVVRTSAAPAAVIGPVRERIRAIDPTLAVLGVQTIDEFRNRLLGITDMLAGLMAIFGAIALVLAAIGLYGVISVTVGQRTQEIGIRMAIGAQRRDVVRMIMGQSGRLVLVGCLFGFAGALAFGRLMSSILLGVSSSDSLSMAAALVLVLVISVVAAYLPARRAANSNPVQTLRSE